MKISNNISIKIHTLMKRGQIGSRNVNEMGDINLGPVRKRYFQKKYSFALGVAEELPLPQGV